MKLDEVFDDNYYDFLQDEMRRKTYDPNKGEPIKDTEMHMGDFILAAFDSGDITFDEAKKRLKEIALTNLEYHFWKTELLINAENKGEL